MRAHVTIAFAILLCLAAIAAALQVGAPSPRTLNDTCPLSGQPVSQSVPTLTHLEETIGFCCPGCRRTFIGWNEEKKFDYIAALVTARAEQQLKTPAPLSRAWKSDLFTLAHCPISGAELGSMGDPSVHTVDDREVRFCCPPCLPRFESMRDRWAEIDRKMIEDQKPHYPLETCIISGRPLGDGAVDHVYRNRLVRFCCPDCVERFEQDPRSHLAKLDAAVIEKQRPIYPLDTCIVRNRTLGVAGPPTEAIVANRLVRMCSAECADELKARPAALLARLAEARADR